MRKTYTSNLKSRVVLEMLKEQKSVSELSSEYGIHPSQLYKWRNHAIENLATVFDRSDNVAALKAEHAKQMEQLYMEIGRLTTKLSWLGKKGFRLD